MIKKLDYNFTELKDLEKFYDEVILLVMLKFEKSNDEISSSKDLENNMIK